jgi:HTH-type transcriptional regulator, sugar sensing transcriptional regulator
MNGEVELILHEIGLTNGETKVYLALNSIGTSTVGPIIDQSRISASKAYSILDRLMHKGLVSITINSGKKIFSAASPEKLLEILDDQKQKIEDNKNKIKEIIPQLKLQQESVSKKPMVEFAKGKKGFMHINHEFIESAKEKDEYITLASKRITFKMQSYWYEHSKNLSKKQISQFLIYDNDSWFKKDPKIHQRSKRVNYYPRYLNEKYNDLPNISVLGYNTLIEDLDEKDEIFTLIIRNKNLTQSIKKLLMIIWDSGKVPEGFDNSSPR